MKKNILDQINPWKKISSQKIYQNQWFSLREDQVISPGGEKSIYGVVETSPAIAIVPLTSKLETYLVGQYRYPLNTYSWEVPEGGADPDESNLEAAKRELKEETGLHHPVFPSSRDLRFAPTSIQHPASRLASCVLRIISHQTHHTQRPTHHGRTIDM